jgi:hypothetical protein
VRALAARVVGLVGALHGFVVPAWSGGGKKPYLPSFVKGDETNEALPDARSNLGAPACE